ncbi:MAG: T9SS type A sorting domain-containing protein [Bacteroidetes bacterium]|nr:T9SS type A sorting domain-containing protein [Bacteroidota bacterium]
MIKRLLIVTILILNTLTVFSYTHLEVPIELMDEFDSNYTLVFGVDESATNTWDSLLGEFNAPRWPPYDSFHAAFEIFDSVRLQELVWSYKDFRPIIDSQHFYVQYSINVVRGDGKLLIFNWGKMPEFIDSAKITDREEDLDLEDFSLTGTKKSDTVRNTSHNDFYVKVWYNNEPKIVYENDNDNSEIFVYPNPAFGDNIFIEAKSPGFSYKIFTETGIELVAGKSEFDRTELKIADLTKGIYFVVLNTAGGNYVKKLVRL